MKKKKKKRRHFPRLTKAAKIARRLGAVGSKRGNQSENRRYMLEFLLAHPCVDCGEKDIIVLEFDHVERSKKRGTITSLLHLDLETVKAEIAKCLVRCCNCHRRRTAVQLGWKTRLALSEKQKKGLC